MAKPKRILNSSMEVFRQQFLNEENQCFKKARLLPLQKIGDEVALTSVFLASLRLIKEFRKDISKAINMTTAGRIHVYTEVEFPEYEKLRPDGLIVVESGGKIKDAALVEVKNGNSHLEVGQIESYIGLAKTFGIPKLVTISNQFVSHPSQYPINVQAPKRMELFHLSWTYVRTIATLLLFENDMNIEDPDQVEIMKEVVAYLERDKSGVCEFTRMESDWKELTDQVNRRAELKAGDKALTGAVESWVQEEKDLALKLSRELGLLVATGGSKSKEDYSSRISSECKKIIDARNLESQFKIDGAVSDIIVRANFDTRNLEAKVSLKAPEDKTLRGQVGWLKRQFKNCESKSPEKWKVIQDDLFVDVGIKFSKPIRVHLSRLDEVIDEQKGKTIREFELVQVKDLGKAFSSTKKFVEALEQMIFDFYQGLVQYLKKWEKPAPKMTTRDVQED